jgi:hypothetical protein
MDDSYWPTASILLCRRTDAIGGFADLNEPALIRRSGCPGGVQELLHFNLEQAAFLGQRLQRGQHAGGCATGIARAAVHLSDIGGNLRGARADAPTLRVISWIAVPCSSTAAEMLKEISEILPIEQRETGAARVVVRY